MENKDYIRQEIENFIIKNTDIKRFPSYISNGGGKIKFFYNPYYDNFIKLNLIIMKYYNSADVSENLLS